MPGTDGGGLKKSNERSVSFSDTIKELKEEMALRRLEEERKRKTAGTTQSLPSKPDKVGGVEPVVPLLQFITDLTGRYGIDSPRTADRAITTQPSQRDSPNLLPDMDLGPFDASEFSPSQPPLGQAPPSAEAPKSGSPPSNRDQDRLPHETPEVAPKEERHESMEGNRLLERLNLGESWKRPQQGTIRDVGPSSIRSLTEEEAPETVKSPAGFRTALGRWNPVRILLSRISGISTAIPTIPFDPGEISQPSMDESSRDVNTTYPVEPPFQFIHIEFDSREGALVYSIREPSLSTEEVTTLGIIERAFEKLISTEGQLVSGMNREAYLKERFFSIVHIFDIRLSDEQKEKLFFHLKKRYLGFGIIDSLMKDRYIEDISCNGPNADLYILHRIYGSIRTNIRYGDVELNNFVLRLAQIAGRHISLLQPIRDVSLPDGSRANLTLGGEVTKKGSTYTIRKFRSNPISPIELMDYNTIDAAQLAYLWLLMEYKRSILVSGGTATGKTTLLNVLCSFIPPEYKIVSIEDTAELNLMHPNWIQSVTRTGFGMSESSEGLSGVSGISRRTPGEIGLYDLLVAALRQRPEFIIVGEVRGEEAFTLFQAIAVGHAALGTIHAGSMDELLARVESNPMRVPRALFSNLDAVVFPMHIKKGERSMRRIANVVEVLEMDKDKGDLITNTVFRWIPETDVFRYQGRSYLFEKIQKTFGVTQDQLTTELVNRTNLLTWMQQHKIRDYKDVTAIIRNYYRDRDEVEAMINKDLAGRLGI